MNPVDPELTYQGISGAKAGHAGPQRTHVLASPRPATYGEFLVSWFKTNLIILGKVIIFAIIVAIPAALILRPDSDDFDDPLPEDILAAFER